MNCTKCSKEITSKITGELCTSCYFASKKNNNEIKETEKETEQRPKAEEEKYEITETNEEPEIKHIPSKKNEVKDPTKKYCQSCIERGYGLVLASREWQKDYFICDDCFEPLVNNMLVVSSNEEKNGIKPQVLADKTTPALEQFYNLLNIPTELRFANSDTIIQERNEIQNHQAMAIVNMSDAEVIEQLEHYRVILFNIRYRMDENQNRINRIKAKAREEKNLNGFEKSKKEVSKGKSTAKLNEQEKLAVRLFPHLKNNPAEAVKFMQEIAKKAKQAEFDKLTGN